MNVLLFDLEHGSQTLGSKDRIKDIFNLPVLSPGDWGQFQNTMASLYKQQKITQVIKIGDTEIEEESTKVVPKNGTKIDAVVLDTFSELSKKYVREISDKNGRMQLQNWGQLKNKLDGCLEFITRVPGIVVCLCHSRIQTMDDGNKVVPYIDGSSKEDVSKWFDFVFYTKTVPGPDNKGRKYVWVTKRDEKYDHAKDRTNLLPQEIPQDYSIVLDAAKERGWEDVRILIIGPPGSGKTYSLSTLIKEKTSENDNDQ
jgi:hypothetical protein